MDAPTKKQGLTLTRVGVLVATILIALLLTWTVTTAQSGTDFEVTKSGPRFARQGEVFTYTIEVTNQGDAKAGVVLSDTLSSLVSFHSCKYWYGWEGEKSAKPCWGTRPQLWELPFGIDTTVYTKLGVRVEAGTALWPLINQAEAMVGGTMGERFPSNRVVTILNTPYQIHLPFVAKNFGS